MARPSKFVESEMIELIAKGFSSKQIADFTKFTHTTIQSYRILILRKYNVKNTAELVSYAYQNGMLKLKPLNGYETETYENYRIRQAG